MKTRHIISIIIIGLVVSYFTIGSFAVGINVLNPYYVLYAPGILKQLIANEGNGIICVDACGPCSAWGYQYILIENQCVLPSVESCKLKSVLGEWEFEGWSCHPVCKEPYTDPCRQEIIMEKIRNNKINKDEIGINLGGEKENEN